MWEKAYYEAVRREKLAVAELNRQRKRAEVAEKQNRVLSAEVRAWQNKCDKLIKNRNHEKDY